MVSNIGRKGRESFLRAWEFSMKRVKQWDRKEIKEKGKKVEETC